MCAWTLRVAYPAAGVPFRVEVEHLAEAAAEAPRRLTPRPPGAPARVAFHDPCYLARHLGVREEPRDVLERLTGAPPLELPWSERGGYCCGGGGLLPETVPETAAAVAGDLIAQAAEVGAEEVITACPRCHRLLTAAAAGGEVLVRDLSELLAER